MGWFKNLKFCYLERCKQQRNVIKTLSSYGYLIIANEY